MYNKKYAKLSDFCLIACFICYIVSTFKHLVHFDYVGFACSSLVVILLVLAILFMKKSKGEL